MGITPHAKRQCETRDFPVEAVLRVVERKLDGRQSESAAVLVGWTKDRGGLIGSNGNEVWAIVRGGEIVTVMLRRDDQPKTKAALRVEEVLA